MPANDDAISPAPRLAWGHGLATIAGDGTTLDAWFPAPALGARPSAEASGTLSAETLALVGPDARRDVRVEAVTVEIDLDAPPADTADAYLRLHLLSHLLARPNSVNLEGVFAYLPAFVWTNAGPVHPDAFDRLRPTLLRAGIQATGVDKFPRLLDYVTPERVRIADASRVRLGAHLAPGTTVMHEGFVNFNAGTLGTSMVEGRISAGVVVGNGSDVGGGASIMGTLSGGGTQVIAIGERCLIGANAGLGISLGDECVVEAGCYVTAGTKVTVLDPGAEPKVVKAVALSGASNVLFRRNSVTGAVEAVPWRSGGIALNADLHAN
jgi:2,3,4,5-tetrahydropyridine-2,6-dicarboxylate N-succinyltransferase